MNIEFNFEKACNERSDIHKHLPTLQALAKESVVTENGVYECGFRTGTSTWSFLSAKPKVVLSIDINDCDTQVHEHLAEEEGVKFLFRKKDSATYKPREKPFGLTFLDTLHEHDHLLKELRLVSQFTLGYIAIHDTNARWEKEAKTRTAINTFLEENPDSWELYSHTENLHGLTILKRTV